MMKMVEMAARTGQSRAREKTGREVGRASLSVYGGGGGKMSRLWSAMISALVGKGGCESGTASWGSGSDMLASRTVKSRISSLVQTSAKLLTEGLATLASLYETKQTAYKQHSQTENVGRNKGTNWK